MLPEGAEPEVERVTVPESNGMSSETLLFDASWVSDGERRRYELVARVAPDVGDVPVFPSYDLESQFRVMQLVGEHTDVPVPAARWLELDPAAIGAPFFVMDRVEGRVPPDVMPYPMGSWLLDADPADQRALQDASVAVLAGIHGIDIDTVDASFLELDRRATPRCAAMWPTSATTTTGCGATRSSRWWRRRSPGSTTNWPADEGDTVISWGDSRVGNIMYDGFTPVAVLDWEMAVARAARHRRRVDDLHPRLLPGHLPGAGDGGHARVHAQRGRRRHLRRARRQCP